MTNLAALTDEELSDRCAAYTREMWRRRYDKPAVQAALTAITDSKATSDVQLAQEVLLGLRTAGYRVVKTEPYDRGELIVPDPRDDIVEITEEWTP